MRQDSRIQKQGHGEKQINENVKIVTDCNQKIFKEFQGSSIAHHCVNVLHAQQNRPNARDYK